MAKKTVSTNKITSVTQESTDQHTDTVPASIDIDIELKPGYVLVAQVENGVETGVTFTVREKEYQKHYSDSNKFIVKKKAN